MAARWSWPPDSVCGCRSDQSPAPGPPTRAARRPGARPSPRHAGRRAAAAPRERPTVRRGSNDACGSWNTSWTRRRSASARPCPSVGRNGRPSSRTSPLRRDGRGPTAMRGSVVLPQPDSPTRPDDLARRDGQVDAIDRPRRPGRPTGTSDGCRRAARIGHRAGLAGAPAGDAAVLERARAAGSRAAVVDRPAGSAARTRSRCRRPGHPAGQLRQPRVDARPRSRRERQRRGAQRDRCRGAPGRAMSSIAPAAPRRSRPAYSTAIRSATAAGHGQVVGHQQRARRPRSSTSPTSRSSTWAWTVASSAVVGSSARITSGPAASAAAIAARWRRPPDS